MKPIYFRDFLSTFIARGGDISKITFRSTNLVSKYKVLKIETGLLQCIRMRPDGRTEPAHFEWPSRLKTGIYGGFTVARLEENPIGRGLRKEVHLTLHLRSSGN